MAEPLLRGLLARTPVRIAALVLYLLAGAAVCAPFVASERPYFARVLDAAEVRAASESLVPLAASLQRLRGLSDTEYERQRLAGSTSTRAEAAERERRALRTRLEILRRARPQGAWLELQAELERALARPEAGASGAAESIRRAFAELPAGELEARPFWPLLATVEPHSVLALLLWLVLGAAWLGRFSGRRLGLCVLLALLAASLWPLVRPLDPHLDGRTWKERLAAPEMRVESVRFAPLALGPAETSSSEAWLPPSSRHLLGTDGLGRDVLARALWGARTSLAIGFGAALLLALVGTLVGAVAGTLRGRVDLVLSRLIEVVLCFPAFFLVLACAALADRHAISPAWFVTLVIAGVGWTGVARLVRAQCLEIVQRDFVLAARAQGFTPARILWVHVLPNALAPALVALSFAVGSAILTESALSFLGLGVEVPVPSWGALASETRNPAQWWLIVFPGFLVFATALSASVLGEALRDELDPHSQRGPRG